LAKYKSLKNQSAKKEESQNNSDETLQDVNGLSPVKNISRAKTYLAIGATVLIILVILFGFYIYSNAVLRHKIPPVQNVNIALKWVHQSQFAGNYVAQEKGFYSNFHGINATFMPYNFKDSPIDLVVSGKAKFGVAGADEIMLARSKGIPVKAVAVIYQVNPVCAFALKSSGIARPQDFVGKRIGIEKGINVEYEYNAMMENLKINRSTLTEVGIGYVAAELLNGSVDVSTGYVINEPYYAISAGKDVNIIMVEDYGVNMYADVLFTTDELIKTNPELVNNFVQGTIDGWQYTMEHQSEAVDIVLRYAKTASLNHEVYALQASIPLINTGEVPIGSMNAEGWSNVKHALLLQKLLSGDVNISDCYTTQFIDSRDVRNKI